MDIESKPELKQIGVTDIDIRLPGETLQLTLRPEDAESEKLSDTGTPLLVIEYANGEHVAVSLDKVLWISRRKRMMTVPPDPADAAKD